MEQSTMKIAPDGTKVFQLESPIAGIPSSGAIEELRHLRRVAADAVSDYGEAIKIQAEKSNLKPGALRRYIAALENDRTEDAKQEAADLEMLLGVAL